jgi:hypothetical protein
LLQGHAKPSIGATKLTIATELSPSPDQARIEWRYLWGVALAIAALIAVIRGDSHWLLNFFHVITGLLWTGIDLFMGFIIGPILRRLDLPARRAIVTRLVPRMLFLMPTLAITASTAGIELANRLGYFGLDWPEYGWVLAALIIVGVLTVQGLGILLPINVMVFRQLRRAEPDFSRVGRLMRIYFLTVASQAVMQVAIILVMARFVTGL